MTDTLPTFEEWKKENPQNSTRFTSKYAAFSTGFNACRDLALPEIESGNELLKMQEWTMAAQQAEIERLRKVLDHIVNGSFPNTPSAESCVNAVADYARAALAESTVT